MPVLDGLSAAEQIAGDRIAPVIVLTAFSQRELVERARDAGAMAYLVKPFSKNDLVPAIEVARARFAEMTRSGRRGAHPARSGCEARKVVERAKGRLMAEQGMTEAGGVPLDPADGDEQAHVDEGARRDRSCAGARRSAAAGRRAADRRTGRFVTRSDAGHTAGSPDERPVAVTFASRTVSLVITLIDTATSRCLRFPRPDIQSTHFAACAIAAMNRRTQLMRSTRPAMVGPAAGAGGRAGADGVFQRQQHKLPAAPAGGGLGGSGGGQTYKIAFQGPLSGDNAAAGHQRGQRASQLAVDQANKKGDLGFKLELRQGRRPGSTRAGPDRGRRRSCRTTPCSASIGPSFSGATKAVGATYGDAGLALISPVGDQRRRCRTQGFTDLPPDRPAGQRRGLAGRRPGSAKKATRRSS